jgi:flagellar biosynthetic protein FliQ
VNPQSVITIGQQALYTMLLLAAPLLLAALVVGLVISILQAATQINEMTLSFIPKLIAMVAAMAIAGPWMISFFIEAGFSSSSSSSARSPRLASRSCSTLNASSLAGVAVTSAKLA